LQKLEIGLTAIAYNISQMTAKMIATEPTESEIESAISVEDRECPQQWDVSASRNVPGFVRPTHKSQRWVDKVLAMVNAIEPRGNNGFMKM
jgi:hypothetical protein